MNKKQIVASLNKIANELDNNGLYKEANSLTMIMKRLAQDYDPSYDMGGDDPETANKFYKEQEPTRGSMHKAKDWTVKIHHKGVNIAEIPVSQIVNSTMFTFGDITKVLKASNLMGTVGYDWHMGNSDYNGWNFETDFDTNTYTIEVTPNFQQARNNQPEIKQLYDAAYNAYHESKENIQRRIREEDALNKFDPMV
jgi:hypothetical protein